MNTLDANAQYSGFVAARNGETVVRWQKVQIFFLINSMLLGVVASAALAEKLRILIGIFGLAVTIIWWLIQWEAQNAIDFWNGKIASLEKESKAIVSGFSFKKTTRGLSIQDCFHPLYDSCPHKAFWYWADKSTYLLLLHIN